MRGEKEPKRKTKSSSLLSSPPTGEEKQLLIEVSRNKKHMVGKNLRLLHRDVNEQIQLALVRFEVLIIELKVRAVDPLVAGLR